MFVHFDIFHIGFNMIALYYFGRLNEISYSRGEYLAIYFGAGLLGNAVSLFLIPLDVQTGGASGAIFGLIGLVRGEEPQPRQHSAGARLRGLHPHRELGAGGQRLRARLRRRGGFALGLLFTRMRPPE